MDEPIEQEVEQEDTYNLTKKERKQLRREEKRAGIEKQRSSKKMHKLILWGGVVALLGLGVAGIVFLVGNTDFEGTGLSEVDEQDHAKGGENASVVLVEYADLQCPACAAFHPIIKQLGEDFGEDLKIVFRHYPLTSIHPNATVAGQAVEAAHLQGKFWEMHDMIFENQPSWSRGGSARDAFVEYAGDVTQFEQDMELPEISDRIQNDTREGTAAGVRGTPSFFLQGQRIANPRNYEAFSSIINAAIHEASL
jgi:protein-disulfide isomerase